MRKSLLKANAPLFEWLVRLFDPLLAILAGWLAYRWYLGTWIPPGAVPPRADRRGDILLCALSTIAPLFAAARRHAVRRSWPAGECLAAACRRLVRLPVPVQVRRRLLARLVAVLDRIRRGDAFRVPRGHQARVALVAPTRPQSAPRHHRRRRSSGAGHRPPAGANTLERPCGARLLRRRQGVGRLARRRRRRARSRQPGRARPRDRFHRPDLDRAAAARGRAHPGAAAGTSPALGGGPAGAGHLQLCAAQSFDDGSRGTSGDQSHRIAPLRRESRGKGRRGFRAVADAPHRRIAPHAAYRRGGEALLAWSRLLSPRSALRGTAAISG